MRKFDRYRENLRATDDHVYSYDTKVAVIDHSNKAIMPLGWYSVTTSKHINYVAYEYGYKVVDKMYHVTGVDRDGKRFKIVTASARHADGINLWNGTVWEVDGEGKRTMIRRVYNG
tara:strand:+ start:501 stop:848 length:348 start_codon:yes stop_codon:yes gene_type:complete